MSSKESFDVAVVGAGLAGLTAATRCADRGLSVIVFEARDRVGGRTLTHLLSDGTPLELGGQWIADSQERVSALVAELGLETYPTYNTGEHLIEFGGELSRYRGALPLEPDVLDEINRATGELDELARSIDLDTPWRGEVARELDQMTLAAWADRTCTSELARQYFRLFAQGVLATEPESVSLLHAAFYIHSGGGLARLMGTGRGAQQNRIVGGAQQLSLRLAERLGWRIRLSEPVHRIDWSNDRVTLFTAGASLSARRVVIAVPPVLAGRITYSPPLPSKRDQLTQRMPHGNVIKCLAVYDRAWWRENGLSGQVASDTGPVGVVYDASTPSGVPGVLVAFIEGHHAIAARELDEAERREQVLDCLERYLGSAARDTIGFIERDWSTEEWTRGCYGAHMPPTAITEFGSALREPIGPIHWAGAETATRWCGYLDGAIESGHRVADEIATDSALGPSGPLDRWKWHALDWYGEVVGVSSGRVPSAGEMFEVVLSTDIHSDAQLVQALAEALNAGFGQPTELDRVLVKAGAPLRVVERTNRAGMYWEIERK